MRKIEVEIPVILEKSIILPKIAVKIAAIQPKSMKKTNFPAHKGKNYLYLAIVRCNSINKGKIYRYSTWDCHIRGHGKQ